MEDMSDLGTNFLKKIKDNGENFELVIYRIYSNIRTVSNIRTGKRVIEKYKNSL